jgi:hypothetical protein
MNANLHPALARALMPFAPPQSIVHQIIPARSTFDAVIDGMELHGHLGRLEAEMARKNVVLLTVMQECPL